LIRKFAAHSMRRTKATLIYRRTGTCEWSSCYSATRGTHRTLARVEVDDALEVAEKINA
jgi:hypothetical protein